MKRTGPKAQTAVHDPLGITYLYHPNEKATAISVCLENHERQVETTVKQCMGYMDHVTLNLKNNISMAAVFLHIEYAIARTWHIGLLYKLSKLKFSTSLIKLIRSLLSQRKLGVSVKGEKSTPRDIQAGMPQGSILSPTLWNIYK
jgi:hypothetical protein